jgi:hypothetical protein
MVRLYESLLNHSTVTAIFALAKSKDAFFVSGDESRSQKQVLIDLLTGAG